MTSNHSSVTKIQAAGRRVFRPLSDELADRRVRRTQRIADQARLSCEGSTRPHAPTNGTDDTTEAMRTVLVQTQVGWNSLRQAC